MFVLNEFPNKRSKSILTQNEIIALYLEGYSTSEIGSFSNVSARYIRSILNKNQVEMRPIGSWKRKFKVNENYFKTWSNNMAYILGFFMADGCMVQDQQTISFAQKEKYILMQIKDVIESTHPIIQNPITGVYILNIHSKIMKTDLMKLHGVTSKKSKELIFPIIPEEYMSHFIRGYFDGDGYVNYKSYFVSIVGGSIEFMKSLQNKIEVHGFTTNFTTHENHYRVYVSGRKTIKNFSEWLYKDKELFLERKYEEFNKEKEDISILRDKIKMHNNAKKARSDRGSNNLKNN